MVDCGSGLWSWTVVGLRWWAVVVGCSVGTVAMGCGGGLWWWTLVGGGTPVVDSGGGLCRLTFILEEKFFLLVLS